MKKMLLLLMFSMMLANICFAAFFANFQEEKNYCVNTAFKKVRELGEKPVAWYTDHSTFSKMNDHTAAFIYVECENNKLAYCHVQYRIEKSFWGNEEKINVYQNSATISDNFFKNRW